MQIPKQLNKFRFIKTYRKNASEVAWPLDPVRFQKQNDGSYLDTIKNIKYKSKGQIYKGPIRSYTYDEIQYDLETQTNSQNLTYGVLCGFNGLVVIDLDDKKTAEKLMKIYPFSDTFTVLSGTKQLPHFYFKCEDYQSPIRYDNSSGKRLLDVQGTSTYVIGPNSYMYSNNEKRSYRIHNEDDVIEISFDKLIKILEENIGETHKIQKKQKNPYTGDYFIIDPISDIIFQRITCDEILSDAGVDISNNPGDTPFADSVGGRCLHRSGYLWYDHHTQQGGTVIQLYAKIHKIEITEAKYDLADQAGITEEEFKKAMQYLVKNQRHELTEYLAKQFMQSNKVYTIRSDKFPEIFIYTEGIYKADGRTRIEEFCDKRLQHWYTSTVCKPVIDKIMARTYIDQDDFFMEPDTKYIAVNNGILDTETRKLSPFDPNMRFFNKIPVNYDSKATCEITINHYNTVLNGEQDTKVMQELYGYLLYRKYKIESAFMFYGNGSNGKSKTISQLGAFIGVKNFLSADLQDLQNNNYMRGELLKKLANLGDDIGNTKLEETKTFKQLSGRSTITVDRKFKNTITFESYAKMIFSANKVPETADNSDAFWRRWIMLGFTKKFLKKPKYEKYKKEGLLKPNHRLADMDMCEKLTKPEELSGVLNWALDGLQRLLENEGFSKTDSENEVRRIWCRQSSTVVAFIQDHVTKTYNPEHYEKHEDLYGKYIQYCVSINKIAESEREFKKHMQQENILLQRKSVAMGKEWRYIGVYYK